MSRKFDGYSRSRATMQLCQLAEMDLVSEEELAQFSEETRAAVDNFLRVKRGA
ncbi:MAG: hypothetical protein U5O39_20050 [Gammaproteobacteria bacterium]|nr:hypothetical protein [Gammaproteobacteria bacterium]